MVLLYQLSQCSLVSISNNFFVLIMLKHCLSYLTGLIDFVDFDPPNKSRSKKYIIIGVVSAACLLLIALAILWWKGYFGGKASREQGKK